MNLGTIFAAVLFLGSVLISQKLAINASAKLDDQTRLRIMDIFPKRNLNYTILVYSLIIVFLAALYAFPEHAFKLWGVYTVLLAIYFALKFARNIKTLKGIGAPSDYIRSIVASYVAFSVGAVLALVVLLGSGFSRAY